MISFVHILINQDEKAHSPPLGVLGLVATMRAAALPVKFIQYIHHKGTPLSPAALADVLSITPGIVAISIMINVLPILVLALRILRASAPGKVVVVGGPGMVGVGREVLLAVPEVDVVAFGEGENVVVPLFQALLQRRSLHGVPSIHYRVAGAVFSTLPAERVACLDELALPDYAKIDLANYHGVGLMASRGCPFGCTFCDVAPAWGRKNTRRSVDHVLEEMAALHSRFHVHDIGFADDLFILDRHWVREFCEEKIRRGLPTSWRCNGHINLANSELSALMSQAGCRSMFFGIESGSNPTLKKIKKNFSIEKAMLVIAETLAHMDVSTNFMWGFPGETPDDLHATLRARNKVELLGASSSLVMLAPLNQSPICAGDYPKKFDRNVPNIFCEDYKELDPAHVGEWTSLVQSHPVMLSAFYHFDIPGIAEMRDMISVDSMLKFALDEATPPALWQRV